MLEDGTYVAIVETTDFREWRLDDGGESGVYLYIVWRVGDVTATQVVVFDLTESGGIDLGMGKNIDLGKLRAELGLDTPGMPFAFGMLQGRTAQITVRRRPAKSETGMPLGDVISVA